MQQAEPVVMSAPYFVSLGRLERYKRVDRLIDAMTQVPEPARLVVVGSGPARPELLELASARGVAPRVEFRENLPRSEVRGLLAGAQAVVTMSEHEAFGLTLLEGIAAGRHAIASDLPAHREVSRFAATDAVRLMPLASDRAQLAEAMRDCLGRTRDLDRGARVPSWEHVGRRTLAVYRSIAGPRGVDSQLQQAARA
jgi:glycosyltransferase involved in cell wall biosynthesis